MKNPECISKNHPYKTRQKCNCNSCKQSIKDQGYSDNLRRSHKLGKFCKEHNQCPKCCKIKQIVRFLRHSSGIRCGRRCEACKDRYYASYMAARTVAGGGIENNVRRVYLYMLKDLIWF